MAGTDYSGCKHREWREVGQEQALANAAKFTAAENRIADPVDQLNEAINQLISRYYFWISLFCSCLLRPGLANT
jgi:hypothetical protein